MLSSERTAHVLTPEQADKPKRMENSLAPLSTYRIAPPSDPPMSKLMVRRNIARYIKNHPSTPQPGEPRYYDHNRPAWLLGHVDTASKARLQEQSLMTRMRPDYNPFESWRGPVPASSALQPFIHMYPGSINYAPSHSKVANRLDALVDRLSDPNSDFVKKYLDGDSTLVRKWFDDIWVGQDADKMDSMGGLAYDHGLSVPDDRHQNDYPTNIPEHELGHSYEFLINAISDMTGYGTPHGDDYLDSLRLTPNSDIPDEQLDMSDHYGGGLEELSRRERMSSLFEIMKANELVSGKHISDASYEDFGKTYAAVASRGADGRVHMTQPIYGSSIFGIDGVPIDYPLLRDINNITNEFFKNRLPEWRDVIRYNVHNLHKEGENNAEWLPGNVTQYLYDKNNETNRSLVDRYYNGTGFLQYNIDGGFATGLIIDPDNPRLRKMLDALKLTFPQKSESGAR